MSDDKIRIDNKVEREWEGYRPGWWPNHDGYENRTPYTVLEIVDQVHSHTMGSCEQLDEEWVAFLVRCLNELVTNWQPPSAASWNFDNAMLQLVRLTIEDYNARYGDEF